jgi:4-amino-4-deoxy-L-arabinose transferase-like glycosyltransferase
MFDGRAKRGAIPLDHRAGLCQTLSHSMLHRLLFWICVLTIFIFGCVLRLKVWHPEGYQPGFDEQVYISYVDQFDKGGLRGFPETVKTYIVEVQKAEFVYLTPFRVGYTVPAWALARLFSLENYQALRLVSALASCAFALAGFLFARRWLTPRQALSVLAFLAFAPLQVHLGQYAFVDAVAGFWALLVVACTWESLQQQPRRYVWLAAACLSFVGLCLSKQETAVFLSAFLFLALVLARTFGWSDSVPWRQGLALFFSGLLAVGVLAVISGGFSPMAEAFGIYRERARTLPYTIQTGDGPWHRYLLEYLLINPLVFLLAVGFAFRADFSNRVNGFFLLLIAVTWLFMSSIPFGMNIRHTVMWDFPLALFAVQCIAALTARAQWQILWAGILVAIVCFTELRQYGTIFTGLYDTDLRFMLRAVKILK